MFSVSHFHRCVGIAGGYTVKWPGQRRLEDKILALESAIVVLTLKHDQMCRQAAMEGTRANAAESVQTALQGEKSTLTRLNDRLEHELELVRADYRVLTQQVINIAARPISKSIFDDDPFKEIKKDDEFVSPETTETVDFEHLAQTIEEASGEQASTS